MTSSSNDLPHVNSIVPVVPFTKTFGDSMERKECASLGPRQATAAKLELSYSSSDSSKKSNSSNSLPDLRFVGLPPPSKPSAPASKENLASRMSATDITNNPMPPHSLSAAHRPVEVLDDNENINGHRDIDQSGKSNSYINVVRVH